MAVLVDPCDYESEISVVQFEIRLGRSGKVGYCLNDFVAAESMGREWIVAILALFGTLCAVERAALCLRNLEQHAGSSSTGSST